MAAITLAADVPENARAPLRISYSTHPKLKISLRASASLPRKRSGALDSRI
jgi:hypothetical protein